MDRKAFINRFTRETGSQPRCIHVVPGVAMLAVSHVTNPVFHVASTDPRDKSYSIVDSQDEHRVNNTDVFTVDGYQVVANRTTDELTINGTLGASYYQADTYRKARDLKGNEI